MRQFFGLLFRIMKGQFWHPTEIPRGLIGYTVEGDDGAVHRSSNEDWRGQWKWMVFHLDSPGRIFFKTEGVEREFFSMIHERFVALRIGPEEVTFYAIDKEDKEISLRKFTSFPSTRSDAETLFKCGGIGLGACAWI